MIYYYQLSVIFVISACNFNIQSNTGTILSPGYGVVNYPGALECFWVISSVHGRPLRLTFTDYEVENGKDFVQVCFTHSL